MAKKVQKPVKLGGSYEQEINKITGNVKNWSVALYFILVLFLLQVMVVFGNHKNNHSLFCSFWSTIHWVNTFSIWLTEQKSQNQNCRKLQKGNDKWAQLAFKLESCKLCLMWRNFYEKWTQADTVGSNKVYDLQRSIQETLT